MRKAIADLLGTRSHRPVVVGIAGAQGSGKSTLARNIASGLNADGIASALLSIDDLYLTRDERLRLARDVHPLLATRGPPGTHDVELGLALISELRAGRPCAFPRFDKGRDDRVPTSEWTPVRAGVQVLLLEGWCIGARPQCAEDLETPVNSLEAQEDADGRWRSYVNDALADSYQQLFSQIDLLALLQAPDFDVVLDWRAEQEEDLRETSGGERQILMDKAGLKRFIQHYERITRHMLSEMPERADMVIELDLQRRPVAIRYPHSGADSR